MTPRLGIAAALSAVLGLAACAASDDPAEGGFFNGVAGLAGGGYQARITEREQAVAAAQTQGAALSVDLARLEAKHAALQRQLVAQEAALRARGIGVPPGTDARIRQASATAPASADADARVASLQRSIADMQALSAQLAAVAG